jgi:hypothetical protein
MREAQQTAGAPCITPYALQLPFVGAVFALRFNNINHEPHEQTRTRTSLVGIIPKFSSLFVGKEDEKG